MKNSNYIKNKVNKLNISKSNSRYVSFLNNNTNTNTNINNITNNTNTNIITNIQETQMSNKNFKKKMALKPQINQFEYIIHELFYYIQLSYKGHNLYLD